MRFPFLAEVRLFLERRVKSHGQTRPGMITGASSLPSHHWHQLEPEEVVRLLDVDLRVGLSGAEAKRRLESEES